MVTIEQILHDFLGAISKDCNVSKGFSKERVASLNFYSDVANVLYNVSPENRLIVLDKLVYLERKWFKESENFTFVGSSLYELLVEFNIQHVKPDLNLIRLMTGTPNSDSLKTDQKLQAEYGPSTFKVTSDHLHNK